MRSRAATRAHACRQLVAHEAGNRQLSVAPARRRPAPYRRQATVFAEVWKHLGNEMRGTRRDQSAGCDDPLIFNANDVGSLIGVELIGLPTVDSRRPPPLQANETVVSAPQKLVELALMERRLVD